MKRQRIVLPVDWLVRERKNRPVLGGGHRVKKHLREKIHHIYMLRMKSHKKERNGSYDRVFNP